MPNELLPHEVAELIPKMSDDEYQSLKADIAKHGQREPLVVHEGKILDGRHRYRACMELGLEPRTESWDARGSAVTFVISQNLHRRHLTASQRAAVAVQATTMYEAERNARVRQRRGAVTAGRASGAARRDRPKVEEIVPPRSRRLQARDEVATEFGANPRYIQDAKTLRDAAPQLLDQVVRGERTLPQAKQELRREQKRAELKAKAERVQETTATDPSWEVRHGDCIQILPTIKDPARLIFADPPYNIGIDYGEGQAADRLSDEDYMAWAESWLTACRDRLTPDGALWVLIGDEYAAEYAVILKRLGLTIRSWIKWFEAFGVNCSRNFNRCSRHLFYCVRDPNQFVFHEDAVIRPSDRQTKYRDKRAAGGGKLWDNVWGIEPAIPRLTGTCKERIPDFPTQLPLALLEPIVQCASEPGDLVIDPFNGSGTTGAAAIRHGRCYIGIEKSTKFAELARLRLKGVSRD